jgi:hypothetical protein
MTKPGNGRISQRQSRLEEKRAAAQTLRNHRSALKPRVILSRSGGLFSPRIPFLRRAKVPGQGSFRGK